MKKCPKCNRIFGNDVGFCDLDGVLLRDSAQTAHTLVGRIINQRYRIIEKLAEGGMSAIYLAEQTDMQRKIALKVLNEEYTRNDPCVRRFREEVMLAASLDHQNILQVFDFGETDDGNLFMAMEHLAGTDLKEVIRKGPVEIPRAVHLSIQIADALGAAHRAGLVHRDLKPGNIMVVGKMT